LFFWQVEGDLSEEKNVGFLFCILTLQVDDLVALERNLGDEGEEDLDS